MTPNCLTDRCFTQGFLPPERLFATDIRLLPLSITTQFHLLTQNADGKMFKSHNNIVLFSPEMENYAVSLLSLPSSLAWLTFQGQMSQRPLIAEVVLGPGYTVTLLLYIVVMDNFYSFYSL